ncbi:Argininosuccinate lyase [Colletotrichum tropicale]|nr:Argininosuccinate lyase [Colletotrichum tropicale]
MEQYNENIHFDKHLNSRFEEIKRGLLEVGKGWEAANFKIVQGNEDTHAANERRLGEIIGKDFVCDLHVWLRDELRKLEGHLISFLGVTADRVEKEIDSIVPGHTHLQRPEPVRWSHWMLSYAESIGRGALAGNPFNIHRETGIPMNELFYEQLKSVDARFEEDIAETFNYEKSVEMRDFNGGTSRSSVLEQVAVLRASLQ